MVDTVAKQRTEALERANEIRLDRAQIKRDLKMRKISIVDLLLDPPDSLATMPVLDLVRSIPAYGDRKINQLAHYCRISHRRTVGNLTERERSELLRGLKLYTPQSKRR